MTTQPPVFEVEAASVSGAPGVVVRGEVDISTATQLTAAIDAAIRESVGAFVVDLSGVEFLDSSGVHVLVRARAVLGREERELVVVCPPGPRGASSRSPASPTCSRCLTRARTRRRRSSRPSAVMLVWFGPVPGSTAVP